MNCRRIVPHLGFLPDADRRDHTLHRGFFVGLVIKRSMIYLLSLILGRFNGFPQFAGHVAELHTFPGGA
jgi:hypothetical protein